MKVLKKGRPQKGWAKEFDCTGEGNGGGGCGARLLVEQADVYQTSSSAMGEVDYYNAFKCPECDVETDIASSVRLPFNPKPKNNNLSAASSNGQSVKSNDFEGSGFESRAAQPTNDTCIYDLAWIGKCGKPATYGICNKHSFVKCKCGKQATRECSEALQFVCGTPLCDKCHCHY